MTHVERARWLIDSGDVRGGLLELKRGANQLDPSSFVELAIWYLEGRWVRRDLALARECFRRAGELGDNSAEHAFICFVANGVGGPPAWQTALLRLRRLAERDDRAALQIKLLSQMVSTQEGTPTTFWQSEVLCTSPETWTFRHLFSTEECAYLMSAAEPLLRQSVIVDPVTSELRQHPVRTSDGAAFPFVSEDLVITALNHRIAAASATDFKCGEPLQVLRYRPGQEYRPHLDALSMSNNQRTMTMLVYLNAGYIGGETLFTETGVTFRGGVGDALLFRNARPDGSPDPMSKHAGLPVSEGQKYLATRWIRERPLLVG